MLTAPAPGLQALTARGSAGSFGRSGRGSPFPSRETRRVGRVYNLGAGDPQSVNRLVELLGGGVTRIPKRPGEPDCTWADITRITTELDWHPRVDFEQGVANIVANIDYWRNAPLWDPISIANA